MHSTGVVIVSLTVAAASVIGVRFSVSVTLAILCVAVALVGVPHGALDHWRGRRLLHRHLPKTWPLVFFPAYLLVAMIVVAGWLLVPVPTIVAFFLVSAWHFGWEDEQPDLPSNAKNHLAAIVIGGLVIWVPVLMRGPEVESLLRSIMPTAAADAPESAMTAVRLVAWFALPIAVVTTARDFTDATRRSRGVRNAAFILLFSVADVLVSFGIYFCGWHSVRGLKRLASENALSRRQMLPAVLPLSLSAIVLALVGMGWWSSGQSLPDAAARTLFVALSAMAVPHLVLHGPIDLVAAAFRGQASEARPAEAVG